MHAKILLAGGEWRPRALVLAQLIEEGYDVTAVETWDEAELLLRKGATQPAVVVFDVEGEQHPQAALTTLGRLVAPGRVLILTSASILPAAAVRSLGFERVLARPYSVGDVVTSIGGLVREVNPTNDERPTTGDERPTTGDQRPTTNDQRPTTNDQRP